MNALQFAEIESLLVLLAPDVPPERVELVALGDGPQARWKLVTPHRAFFLKTAADVDMLRSELHGLEMLAATQTVRVPVTHGVHDTGQRHLLCLEYIDTALLNDSAASELGVQLAALHRFTDERHGLDTDNFIGLAKQSNSRASSWAVFFAEQRLHPQLEMLQKNVSPEWIGSGWQLLDELPRWLEGHEPEASLLHGDLWAGNVATTSADGDPVVFDPAVHFGDRECDLAMSRLFGGFPECFYSAYAQQWPLPVGWEQRQQLYQLYHLLNHANLFGGSYIDSCGSLIDGLLT